MVIGRTALPVGGGTDMILVQAVLVYPRDMDGSADRLSIFAPVGSALLGLAVGDELAWPGPGGKPMTVKVKAIVYQPESAGELHR